MPTTTPQRSTQLSALIDAEAWTDTTVLDLLRDFVDAHPTEGDVLLAYLNGRAELERDIEERDEDEDPGTPPGRSVSDLDDKFGIQRAVSGDLLTHADVKDLPLQRIWTIVEGDGGSQWALPGFHVVNRLGYVSTEREWTNEDEDYRFDD
jgi:hypothetical protein